MAAHRGPSVFTKFRTELPFNLHLSVTDPAFRQGPDGSRAYYTRNRVVQQQIRQAGDGIRILADNTRFATLPPSQWRRDYGRQKVMFVLPSEALGDCVGAVLFLRAFRLRFPQATVTIANTGAATDIFGREPGLRVLPLVISEKELEAHFPIIDLGDVDGWDTVTTQPVDMELVLLDRFGLEPAPLPPRRPPSAPPAIAILPLASSPLRTLPPMAVAAMAVALAERGTVSVMLNAYQGIKQGYERMLRPLLPDAIRILPGTRTTGELMDFLAAQDFLVAADSGPAHLSKLTGLPGLAIYTSASGAVLQGRHRNLERWQSPFAGPHCQAPCGLAKLRQDGGGRVGCMGSLGLPLADLPHLVTASAPEEAERLVLEAPVPCVAQLIDFRDDLAQMASTLLATQV